MSHRLLIDGRLVAGAQSLDVIDPTRAAVFAQSPRADAAQAGRAIAAAKRALRNWAALGYDGRRPYLERMADAMAANRDRIAETLTRERGDGAQFKPRAFQGAT